MPEANKKFFPTFVFKNISKNVPYLLYQLKGGPKLDAIGHP